MNTFLKNPFNYTGGKYKLLPQILPLFPDKINTFVDLFCGGGDVFLNVEATKTIANDNLSPLIHIHNEFKTKNIEQILEEIEKYVEQNGLTSENQANYLVARDNYNAKTINNPIDLYAICCFAYNNQLRFNQQGAFNSHFGRRRWNKSLEKKLIEYCEKVKSIDINFTSNDFSKIDVDSFDDTDFVYADPPYLLSTATYNEGGKWSLEKDKKLLDFLDVLNDKNIKFALSNLIETKGKEHMLLKNWANNKKYNIFCIDRSYKGACFQRDNSHPDHEVLITNFKKEG